MPLEPKYADLAMRVGIDEDTDQASDPEGLLALENAEYTKEGAVRGRAGFVRSVIFPLEQKVRGLVQANGSLGVVTNDKIEVVYPSTGYVATAEISGIGHAKTLFLGSNGQSVVQCDSHRKVVNTVDYTLVAMTVNTHTDLSEGTAYRPKNSRATRVAYQLRESLTGVVLREGILTVNTSEYAVRVVNWTTGWIVLAIDELDLNAGQPKLVAYHIPGITGSITKENVAPNVDHGWDRALHHMGCPYDAVFDNHPDTLGGPAVDKVYIAMWTVAPGGYEQKVFIYKPGVPTPAGVAATPTLLLLDDLNRTTCTQAICVAEDVGGTAYVMTALTGNLPGRQVVVLSFRASGGTLTYTNRAVLPLIGGDVSSSENQAMIVATMCQPLPGERVLLLYTTDTERPNETLSEDTYHINATHAVEIPVNGGSISRNETWPGVFPSTKLAVLPGIVDGTKAGMFCGMHGAFANITNYRSTYLTRCVDGNYRVLGHPNPVATLLHDEETWPTSSFSYTVDFGYDESPNNTDMAGELVLPALIPFNGGFTVTSPVALETILYGNKMMRRYRTVDVAVDPAERRPVVYAQIAGSATIAGALPTVWDGTSTSQAAWLYAPPAPVIEVTPGSSGNFSFIQVLEHIDHNGTIVRSPPSPPAQPMVLNPPPLYDGSASDYRFLPKLYEPFLDRGDTAGYRIKLYRTANDGVPNYKLILNMSVHPEVEYDAWVDNVLESTPGREPLYSLPGVPGELPAEPVPAFEHVCVHRNRVIGVRSDSHAIRYSKEVVESFRPEYPAEFEIRVDNDAGPPTAVASLTDLLVVFQENAVCVVDGQGPDATGTPLGAFTLPQKTITGYGVSKLDNASVVTTPAGVFFRHSSGIKLMNRPTEVLDIGDAVRDQVLSLGHVAGAYMSSLRQVWFYGTNPSNKILVLDIDRLRWAVWTPNLAGAFVRGATEVNGVQYIVTDAALWTRDPSIFCERRGSQNYPYTEVLDIPWFRGAGQAGMQRVWDVAISLHREYTATVPSFNATLKVEVFTQQAHRDWKQSQIPDATYNFPSAEFPPYVGQFILTLRPKVQRCIGMRLRITITGSAADPGEPPRVSNVRYHFGVVTPQGKAPTFPTIT